ncbi:hypothetical protein RND81_01G131900 [Saponaria officinalis]|uniref:DUF223 domain-containing protein n=1 Tax=Saponaria officinalis TaxID=3572 RepID=A0AAW1N7G7_SAPOF
MVLIDEEGEYIHGTLPGYNTSRIRQKLVEGKIYVFKNFEVLPNKQEYRIVSDSKIMISLQFDTFVKVVNEESTIPKHRFDFVPFHNLDNRRDNFSVLSGMLISSYYIIYLKSIFSLIKLNLISFFLLSLSIDLYGIVVNEIGEQSDLRIEIEDQRYISNIE